MEYEIIKIVVSPYSGRLFAEFDDGSMLPVQTDKLGQAYIDYYPRGKADEEEEG